MENRLNKLNFLDIIVLIIGVLALTTLVMLLLFKPIIENRYYRLSQELIEKNNLNQAIKEINYSLKLNPESSKLHEALGRIYIEKKDYLLSSKELEKAIELDNNNYFAYLYLGISYYNQDKFNEAIEKLEKAIELNNENKNNSKALYYIAVSYYRQGLIDLALSKLHESIIVNEKNYNAEKMQLKMEQWLEPIYSALDIWASSAALNDFKRITGTTLKKSASKLGLEARGFGRPPETVKIVQSFSSKKEEQGLFKAITSTLNEKISSLARFSANYQNFSKEDVILALRKKLSENLKNDHSKYIPELQDALNYQLKRYEKSIESMNNSQNPMKDLILRDKSIPEEYIPDALLYSGQVLSFVQSPTLYEIGLWPKALITAIYKKDIKMLSQFLKNYGEHMRLMRKLRTYHIKNKIKQYAVLIKKFQISSKNKLSNSELIANLTDEELSLLYEASKLYDWLGNANIDKKILQHIPFTKGPLRELRPWFEAHENIVSALKPLHPNLRKLSQEEMKNYEPTHYYDEATDTYVSKDDLKAWYRFMQENDWTQNPDKNIKRLNDGFDETFLGK